MGVPRSIQSVGVETKISLADFLFGPNHESHQFHRSVARIARFILVKYHGHPTCITLTHVVCVIDRSVSLTGEKLYGSLTPVAVCKSLTGLRAPAHASLTCFKRLKWIRDNAGGDAKKITEYVLLRSKHGVNDYAIDETAVDKFQQGVDDLIDATVIDAAT
ncbi:hypothetical protein B0H14DRAFT_2615484 [Mycena olivaceomarginata]|nr:hypothetical protein B0H14DRAFT_2615484 [Mycena olivaceomarginata]